MSSIYGLPLYVTKNHFMNCTEWLEKVDIYSEDMEIKYEEVSHWDDTFVIIEVHVFIYSLTRELLSKVVSTCRIITTISRTNSIPILSTL